MSNYNFHADLKRAESTEDFVAKILQKHFGKSFLSLEWGQASKFYDFKLVTTFLSVRLELKEDFYGKKSGNVAIETKSWGKPSGVTTTKAKFWLLMCHTNQGRILYSIKASKLRDLINEKKYVRFVEGGDKKASEMYLIKRSVIEDNAHILWEE